MTEIAAELREAARAICREMGLEPDAVVSSAYGAPENWEGFVPHARAAASVYAGSFRVMAEVARAAAMNATDQVKAERLHARAVALHEAADLLSGTRAGGTVVPFRPKPTE